MQVKRLDLGVDIVVLPQRRLVVLHPDLDYAESLGAILGTMPDIHIDAAVAMVDQVTPRPREEPPPRRSNFRASMVGLIAALMVVLSGGFVPSSAEADFGPQWRDAADALGLHHCHPSGDHRVCESPKGRVRVRGYEHAFGDLYVARGALSAIVYVFDSEEDAVEFADRHALEVERYGRAVIA